MQAPRIIWQFSCSVWWPRGAVVKFKNKNWKIKAKTKTKTKIKTKNKNKNENENEPFSVASKILSMYMFARYRLGLLYIELHTDFVIKYI